MTEVEPVLTDAHSQALLRQEAVRFALTEDQVARQALNLLVHFREQVASGAQAVILRPLSDDMHDASIETIAVPPAAQLQSSVPLAEFQSYELPARIPAGGPNSRPWYLRPVD